MCKPLGHTDNLPDLFLAHHIRHCSTAPLDYNSSVTVHHRVALLNAVCISIPQPELLLIRTRRARWILSLWITGCRRVITLPHKHSMQPCTKSLRTMSGGTSYKAACCVCGGA